MTDPQPSCSEIAKKLVDAYYASKNEVMPETLRGRELEGAITEALQAKQKTIELLEFKLDTLGTIAAHRNIDMESLRAEVGGLKDLMSSLIEDIEDGTFDKNDNRQQYVLLLKYKVK